MDTKTQEFLMGYILPGSQDTYFDKSKAELIRQEYGKVNFSATQFFNEKELLLRMWREQAKMYGIDPMKVRIERQRELGRDLSLDEEEDIIKLEINLLGLVSRGSLQRLFIINYRTTWLGIWKIEPFIHSRRKYHSEYNIILGRTSGRIA